MLGIGDPKPRGFGIAPRNIQRIKTGIGVTVRRHFFEAFTATGTMRWPVLFASAHRQLLLPPETRGTRLFAGLRFNIFASVWSDVSSPRRPTSVCSTPTSSASPDASETSVSSPPPSAASSSSLSFSNSRRCSPRVRRLPGGRELFREFWFQRSRASFKS